MFNKVALVSFAFLTVTCGQQASNILFEEQHRPLSWQKCTTSGGCTTVSTGSIVVDANWRWLHTGDYYPCYWPGNNWNITACPDGKTCAANCTLDGAHYPDYLGITTSADSLKLKFVTATEEKNIGSRVFLLADDTHYEMFKPLNQEIAFDVDVSYLPCGLNAALYFAEMDADGGMAKYPTNKAGAKYGTGYCDAKCARDVKFINGEANSVGWKPSPLDQTYGTGNYGSCCNEMDIWEANNAASAFTAHPCTVRGQYRCELDDCPSSTSGGLGYVCDPDGCDFNSYRMGDQSFYGKDLSVDTSRNFTVVTQFLTNDNTVTGTLTEIRRLYIQNGTVISNSKVNLPVISAYDSITDQYCTDQKTLFGDPNGFAANGGLKNMGRSFSNGMVLVMSISIDHDRNMLWLDSTYPASADSTKPGIARGRCNTLSGKPDEVIAASANAYVTFSNIRFGDIGSTTAKKPASSTTCTYPPSTGLPTSTSGTPAEPTQKAYGQCGGSGWTGPTKCNDCYTCTPMNIYYSQCLPS